LIEIINAIFDSARIAREYVEREGTAYKLLYPLIFIVVLIIALYVYEHHRGKD